MSSFSFSQTETITESVKKMVDVLSSIEYDLLELVSVVDRQPPSTSESADLAQLVEALAAALTTLAGKADGFTLAIDGVNKQLFDFTAAHNARMRDLANRIQDNTDALHALAGELHQMRGSMTKEG